MLCFQGKALLDGVITEVALKYFNSSVSTKMLKTEIKVLRNLNHKNIVRLYDFNSEENVLILELCFVKLHNQVIYDMRHWSKSSVSRSMSGDLKIFLQVASGLDFLHSCGIIHADIKPDNLLVGGEA